MHAASKRFLTSFIMMLILSGRVRAMTPLFSMNKPSLHVQWNPSIPDTLGPAQSVLIKGYVLISGIYPYRGVPLYIATCICHCLLEDMTKIEKSSSICYQIY
jgi:hypothetical protein